MRNKVANFIMSFVIILIIVILCLFGSIIWKEIASLNEVKAPENFQTVFSDEVAENNTKKNQNVNDNNGILSGIEDANSNNNIINSNRFFYNQLEEPSKIIYDAMEKNKEAMKTGTYKIDFGDTFHSILEQANGQEKLGEYYQSAIEAYTYDNPDVFYLNPNKMYINVETTTSIRGNKYDVYINNGSQRSYLIDEFYSKEQLNVAIQEIEQKKNEIITQRSGNAYQDIKMVHDYLVDTIEYDESVSKPNIYNIYGALVNGEAVCEGYARAFKFIMDELGIPCVLVIGEGTNSKGKIENHAWNYVQLDNRWYAIDTTWDDPIVVGGGKASKSSRYKYFLKDRATFLKDHTPNGQFTADGKIFEYPELY